MVPWSKAARRSRLDGCLRCIFFLGCVLWCIALSAPLEARAADYVTPTIPFSDPTLPSLASCPAKVVYEGSDDSAKATAGLREDLRSYICFNQRDLLREIARRSYWPTVELLHVQERLDLLLAGQTEAAEQRATTNSLLTAVRDRLEGTIDVSASGEVEVTNPPDLTEVSAATTAVGEGLNSTIWGLAGLATGFGLLMVIWRMVQP